MYSIRLTYKADGTPVRSIQVPDPDRPGKYLTRRWVGDGGARYAERFRARAAEGNPADVRNALAAFERERATDAAADGRSLPLAAYAREVIERKIADPSISYTRKSAGRALSMVECYVDDDPIGALSVLAITQDDARAFVTRLATRASRKRGGDGEPLDRHTANLYVRMVRSWLRWAIEVDEIRPDNPFAWFKGLPKSREEKALPKSGARNVRSMTPAEFYPVVAAVADDADAYGLFVLAFESGLRRGELLGLTRADLKPAADGSVIIEVRRSYDVSARSNGAVKTINAPRDVRVHSAVIDALPSGGSDDAPIFNVRRDHLAILRRTLRAAGLPPMTLHGLRHSHATECRRRGMLPEALKVRMGHGNIKTTMGYYVDVDATDQSVAFASPPPFTPTRLRVVA